MTSPSVAGDITVTAARIDIGGSKKTSTGGMIGARIRSKSDCDTQMSKLRIKPCLDSIELAERRRKELAIRPELAESLGRSAVEAIELGYC